MAMRRVAVGIRCDGVTRSGGLQNLLQLPPALRRSIVSAASPQTTPEVYDVICIGAGPAGLSFLSALQAKPETRPLKVALVDSQDLTTSRAMSAPENYSNRCSSLTPTSLKFLAEIGVRRFLDLTRTQPYHGMEIWDGVSGSKISFDPLDANSRPGSSTLDAVAQLVPGNRSRCAESREHFPEGPADDAVATMCENQNLTSALLQRISETARVDLFDKTKVESIDLGPEPESDKGLDLAQWPVVTLPGSRQLAARLLVGADGANSPVRNFAGIPGKGWDYDQHGVVASLDLDAAATGLRTAYQRFLPTGPIALLPLPSNKASLVWSLTTPLALKLKSLSPSDFVAMVNAAFRLSSTDLTYLFDHLHSANISDELSWRLPNTPPATTGLPPTLPEVVDVQNGSIASFPLRMRHASTYIGHRIALIGDAAHTVHPLAGQGLNLGLADAEALAARLSYGMEHGMDVGTSWCLDGYNASRWAANNAVLGVCDKLQKLYSASSGPVVWGRSLGLDLIDRLGPVKGLLMDAAGTRS